MRACFHDESILMKIATLKISLSHVLKASKAQTAAAQQHGHVQHSFPLPDNAQLPRSNHCGALLPRCQQECPISANLFLVTWAPVTKEPDKNNRLSHRGSKQGSN